MFWIAGGQCPIPSMNSAIERRDANMSIQEYATGCIQQLLFQYAGSIHNYDLRRQLLQKSHDFDIIDRRNIDHSFRWNGGFV
jgi:hypothetical protein